MSILRRKVATRAKAAPDVCCWPMAEPPTGGERFGLLRSSGRNRRLRPPPPPLLHAQFPRQLIELRQQRRWQRHAVAQAFDTTGAAAVARQADVVDAWQPLREAQIGEMADGLGHEGRKWDEPRDVDRDHELAGVGGAVLVVVEVNDVAAERCAIEHAAQKAKNDGETTAF